MSTTRRAFIQLSAAGVAGLNLAARSAAVPSAVDPAAQPLKILVLGGTGLIGPPMVQRAVDRGMERAEAQRRLVAQGNGEQRRAAADEILWNDGTREELRQSVVELVRRLQQGTEEE